MSVTELAFASRAPDTGCKLAKPLGATMQHEFRGLIAIFTILLPGAAAACGTVGQAFFTYVIDTDKDRLEQFLTTEACGTAEGYSPEEADRLIAQVLINAIESGVSRNVIEPVLRKYNCAYRARDRWPYKKIVEFVGTDRFDEFCDVSSLQKMYVVSAAGGANVRKSPSLSARKLGAIGDGVLVKNARREGEWLLVDTYIGTGYVHESIVEPY